MKTKLLALVLLASGTMFAAGITVGIHIGAPPAPRVIVRPASPGAGYSWVGGYWYPVEGRYQWHDGYYSRPPYEGAVWIAPRHDGKQYYAGYWQGKGRERVEHDHDSDRDHDRDYRH